MGSTMSETTGQKHTNKVSGDKRPSYNSTRKGDFGEYHAVTWLWDQGYEVFKNCGGSGYIDLVAIKDKEIKLIDVKSTRRKHIKNSRTDKQKEDGVVIVLFNANSKQCRFVEHKNERIKKLSS